jgi:hypothetical protein
MPMDPIPMIAERYQVNEDHVRELYRQLERSNGTQVQFSCPELQGPIQWMPGMVMVSNPTDHQLRSRVDGLCCELVAVLRGSDTAAPAALTRPWNEAAAEGESWWPATFGHATTAGSQNGIRYAYFPDKQRLLVQQGARVDAFDTAGYQIMGAGQQQGNTSTLTFATDRGSISTRELRCVPLA